MMIVGNKIDLRAELETDARKLVQYEDGKKLAKVNGIAFYKNKLSTKMAYDLSLRR